MMTRSCGSDGTIAGGAPERAASDDPADSFTRTFEVALPRLRRVVAGLGFASSDAEDILQDVFLEASQRPGQYRGAAAAERWLIRVVVNRCLLEYRRRRRFRRAGGEILEAARTRQRNIARETAADPARAEEIDRMRDALRELDGSLAAPLVLRYFCEYNATQIGEILELPPATVRSRLRTARLSLAEWLRGEGIEP